MKYTVKLSSRAQRDISSSIDWYDAQRKGLGKDFIVELKKIFRRIEDNPFQFPGTYKNNRQAVIPRFPYSVFFEVRLNTAYITTVFHTRQSPTKLPF
jgi:plasmid stabilization system protein ParE